MNKSQLRKEIRLQKEALTEEQIQEASHALTEQFCSHPLYRQTGSIYVYLSYNQEVRTEEIIRRAWADGKQVAVPKIVGEEMRFFLITENTVIAPGYKDIPEPVEAEEAHDPSALVLLPGLAFDPQGHRLGYGGGFYDRFLSKEPHPTIALCFSFQLLPVLECEAHDIPADAVLSAPIPTCSEASNK